MKRTFFFLGIILILPMISVQAQTRHFGGFSVGGGTSLLFPSPANNLTPRCGGMGDVTALYELQVSHFLLQTGVGASYSANLTDAEMPAFSADIAEYNTLQYVYQPVSFRETCTLIQGYVPLMMGARFEWFHFLLGAKLGIIHVCTLRDRAVVDIYGKDDDVVGEMHDLYTHSMGRHTFLSDGQTYEMTRFPVMASAEVGASIMQTLSMDMRLSLFADFSVNPLFLPKENGTFLLNATDDLTPLPIYGSRGNNSAAVRQLQAGLRLTLLFTSPHSAYHNKCRCLPY